MDRMVRASASAAEHPVGVVYSRLAPFWQSGERRRASDVSAVAERVVRALRAGGDVLDIGCGTGYHLGAIRRAAASAGKATGLLVGVDASRGMLQHAARRRGLHVGAGDALALPFADQVFDVVLASLVLHLLPDPERAAREMVRVAQPGGTLVVEVPGPGYPGVRRMASALPQTSLLRQYLELPRSFRVVAFRSALERLGCTVTESVGPPDDTTGHLLADVARASGRPADLRLARELDGLATRRAPGRLLVARLPGPRHGGMRVTVHGVPGWTSARVRRLIHDLPAARGYRLVVKPLRYRTRPHVQAFCEFEDKRIIVQVPVPFRPFTELVPYRARRVSDSGFRFRWHARRLRFDRPDELIRYLYLHEYYHWYLREVLDRRSAAETACDRFALQRMAVPASARLTPRRAR